MQHPRSGRRDPNRVVTVVFLLGEVDTLAGKMGDKLYYVPVDYPLDGMSYEAAEIDRGGYARFSDDYKWVTVGRGWRQVVIPARYVVLYTYGSYEVFNPRYCRKCRVMSRIENVGWRCPRWENHPERGCQPRQRDEPGHSEAGESPAEAAEKRWGDADWNRWFEEETES